MEDTQHEKEGQEVEDRTGWPIEDHKVADQADVPMLRLFDEARIHHVTAAMQEEAVDKLNIHFQQP